uniref:Thiolase_N domain-containing protein n=1 Tax=Angiostrongylus cantonensis TaxID=6313 RepID=A0A0K0DHS9_ANGCA
MGEYYESQRIGSIARNPRFVAFPDSMSAFIAAGIAVAREIESAQIDKEKFKDKGPLVMQFSFPGHVVHALDDMPSTSIKKVEYDADQNSIVNIGTEVERMQGITEATQMTPYGSVDVSEMRRVP